MSIDQLYERLAAGASLEGGDGAIRITAAYDPAAGAGTKVSPPTYPTGSDSPYVIEDRVSPTGSECRCALLDSRQSQANRCEEALQEAIDAGRLRLPHLVLDVETHGTSVRITSLNAPHRSRDAYFRDALAPDGARFDATPAGAALLAGDAAAYYGPVLPKLTPPASQTRWPILRSVAGRSPAHAVTRTIRRPASDP